MSPLRNQIVKALIESSQGRMAEARLNVEVYLNNPVGIGEHSDVLAAIKTQLDVIAEEQERINVLDDYFSHS